MQNRAVIIQGDHSAPWAQTLQACEPDSTTFHLSVDLAATLDAVERSSEQQALAVVIGPEAANPFAQARRLARSRANLWFMIVTAPDREAALRREAVFAAPPGGRWSIVLVDDPSMGSLLDRSLTASQQQLKLRTTLQRMKQQPVTLPLVDPREYDRLVTSDRYLASVLKNAQDAIVSVDGENAVVSWNKGAERLFGVTEVSARRINLAVLFHDMQAFEDTLAAARRGEHRIGEFGFGQPAEGRYAEATFDSLDSASGRSSVVIIFRETTERRRLQDRLQKDSRQKDEFLAMLAHELRNPLAPIRNAARILTLLELDDPRARNAAGIIARQSTHMAGLIDDLLDVARVTRGAVPIDSAPVSMSELICEAVEQTQGQMQRKHQRLSVRNDCAEAQVKGDKKRLTQVLANLLNNSAKYTPEGGDIALDVSLLGDDVVIKVTDSGIGMEPELIERVFDLFTQGKRETDRMEGGLGIGLALVKALVVSHGGSVTAQSAGPGQGSTLTVRLPRTGPTIPAKVDNSGIAPFRAGNRLRLMVVDDNEDAARTLGMLLESSGHAVDVEIDPRQALENVPGLAPDVFILDIGMPYIDGYELARRIRAMDMNPRPLLIALTGYGLPSDRMRTQQAGFDHHLVKPLDPDELNGLLKTVTAAVRH